MGRGDVVGMFDEPKMGCRIIVGPSVGRKRTAELWLGCLVSRKRVAGMVLEASPCHFGIKHGEATSFWRHLSLIFGPWAGVTPRSGLRA